VIQFSVKTMTFECLDPATTFDVGVVSRSWGEREGYSIAKEAARRFVLLKS